MTVITHRCTLMCSSDQEGRLGGGGGERRDWGMFRDFLFVTLEDEATFKRTSLLDELT